MYAKAGLLSGKEDKGGDFVISSVNRGHPLYEAFRPYKVQGGGGGSTGGGGGGGCGEPAGGGGGNELLIAEVFKPTRELKREQRAGTGVTLGRG